MKSELHRTYIQILSNSRQIEVSRGIETSVEISVEEKRHRQIKLQRSYRGTIQQKLKKSQIDPPTVEIAIKIAIRNSLRSQQIGQVSRKKTSTDEAIEELSRDNSTKAKKKLDRSTSCREAIEGPEIFPIDPPAVETAIEIAIRNNLRSRQIGQVSRGVKEGSRLLKNSFSRREKHIYECNQECNQVCNITKDPNNILNFQNHLSTIIFNHMDSKNIHTHKTSLTNFIFQK